MKTKNFVKWCLLALPVSFLISGCGWTRIGELTMVSTRNVDSKADYKLIKKYAVGKAKSKDNQALKTAIEECVKTEKDGEFLKNVKIYIKNNGRKVKVEGDIWGLPPVEKNVETKVNAVVEFKVGDKVTFRQGGKIVEGTILGVNQNTCVVEHKNMLGKVTKSEVKYEELTKIERKEGNDSKENK
ncbi:MAG: hypothetical protein NZ519_13760 [Bacteroidia bacterium]|nr:hypothetical protein [Bacteroidia bacterium]MDW8348552.1 hypothetical protein [Bacteroidia bacterium]